ncbi:MAG: hypothetical protein M1825_002187 [Sarcosagium campestre]|nr:MAG: hypothetical protein M1825_002187 [Sarcosagium campestre]
MAFVLEHVRRIDAQLDKLYLSAASTPQDSDDERSSTLTPSQDTVRIQNAIKSLSSASSSLNLLTTSKLLRLLNQSRPSDWNLGRDNETEGITRDEDELLWLLVGKATVQTHGLVLKTLLDQSTPMQLDITYWDDVLHSYRYTGLYSIQTSPLRVWDWSKVIYADVKYRASAFRTSPADDDELRPEEVIQQDSSNSFIAEWRKFYHLVSESMKAHTLSNMQRQVIAPFAVGRDEARTKQQYLKKVRDKYACSLGLLMDAGLNFESDDNHMPHSHERGKQLGSGDRDEWKAILEQSVALLESVFRNISYSDMTLSSFEEIVFATLDDATDGTDDQYYLSDSEPVTRQQIIHGRLQKILEHSLPRHVAATADVLKTYGRPPLWIRYWLPTLVLLLSSSTLLRIVVNRKAAIATWLRDGAETAIDFWSNWVVEPIKKVIGTIRHDKESEVAIMSKGSLEGDRASLERMVVEFAVDHPEPAGRGALSESEIGEIRLKVKEGDLTPVLKAYERDLQKPILGTVKGDLIRALLIQIQKTKVDVEVALGGIDALLKSQELVFGFIGLTPGLLVCYGVSRWLRETITRPQGARAGKIHGRMIGQVRNLDRILSNATPNDGGFLSYKDYGLLLWELHGLRSDAKTVLSRTRYREFLEETKVLSQLGAGVHRQLRGVERIRWAFVQSV